MYILSKHRFIDMSIKHIPILLEDQSIPLGEAPSKLMMLPNAASMYYYSLLKLASVV